jgi:hypothetical protein
MNDMDIFLFKRNSLLYECKGTTKILQLSCNLMRRGAIQIVASSLRAVIANLEGEAIQTGHPGLL